MWKCPDCNILAKNLGITNKINCNQFFIVHMEMDKDKCYSCGIYRQNFLYSGGVSLNQMIC